ncbi:hypothetical protein MHH33_08945 [Paenisporosarcina sp. FSL H8-0542]|uniref:hypothetical protein n=1 Tax=unclassified Paenisporosarcina TaxID=2642018 RepID=UPI00034EADAD|nr:hypothetical protein [Paenisporosarcina sp. HGH0030]EPD52061.1 hypothetical protein HMPREF1210_01414 [Paenisporosarcina sp. HGH0030]
MKKKKRLLSVATGFLLLLSLSFATGASAMDDHEGNGPKPICTNNGHCYYP